MKNIVFLSLALLGAASVSAQNNTFPASGNVGIGTTSPSTNLDVVGEIKARDSVIAYNASNEGGRLRVQNGQKTGATTSDWSLWNMTGPYGNGLAFWRYYADGTNAGSSFWLGDNGNVGIGTTNPSYLLHVSGNVGVEGDQKFFARFNSSENFKGSFGWSHLQLGNNGPNWIVAGRTQAGGALTFVVNNTADYAYNAYNGTAALHLAANGNVGVGTIAPSAKLDVVGPLARVQTDQGGWYIYRAATGAFRSAFYDDGNATQIYGDGNGSTPAISIKALNVGIGTASPTHKLAVNGTIRAKEVIVDTGWADHVFAADYRLAPLSEVEQHIQQRGHLPNVPSAADVAERGVSVGEMQKILLQKIEELTLHQIEQEKRLNSQAERIRALETENAQLRNR